MIAFGDVVKQRFQSRMSTNQLSNCHHGAPAGPRKPNAPFSKGTMQLIALIPRKQAIAYQG
eukprot:1154203-Pelagomonas_calceolata.AAC.6